MSKKATTALLFVAGLLWTIGGFGAAVEAISTGEIHGKYRAVFDTSEPMFYIMLAAEIGFAALGLPLVYVAYLAWRYRSKG